MSFKYYFFSFFLLALLGTLGALASTLTLAQGVDDGSPAQRNAQYTEEGTEGCLRCHSGDSMRAIAASPHGNLEHPSEPLATGGCEVCHGPGSIHSSRAFGGKGFPEMLNFGEGENSASRERQVDSCLSCHSKSLGEMDAIEFTNSVHDLVELNCSSCHLAHAESDPISEQDFQATTCYACHTTTQEKHPRFEDKSIDFDALSCWSCHDVHRSE